MMQLTQRTSDAQSNYLIHPRLDFNIRLLLSSLMTSSIIEDRRTSASRLLAPQPPRFPTCILLPFSVLDLNNTTLLRNALIMQQTMPHRDRMHRG